MRRLWVGTLPVVIAASGCFLEGHDPGPPADLSAVVVTGDCPGEPAGVSDPIVSGNGLTFTASYGCVLTEEWICWDGTFLENDPIQVPLTVHHRRSGECLLPVTNTRTVSLGPIIDAYEDTFGRLDPMELKVEHLPVTWQP